VTAAARSKALAVYVLASFLAFPQVVAGRVLDLGLLVSWLAPAGLVLGLAGRSPLEAALAGLLAGLVAHAAILHWIYVVTVTYGHAPVLAGLAAPVALAAYIACFPALFGAGLAWLERRGRAGPFTVALLWTALDHLRAHALTGFPWAALGYAQHRNQALLGLAAWTGVYGLSFATALGGAALAEALRRRRPRAFVPALLATVGLHALGLAARPPAEPGPGPQVRVAVLQGNVDQGIKWSPAFAARTLELYEGLTREAVAAGARLVVWPETAVPGSLATDPVLAERVARLARESGALLVVGGVGIEGPAPEWRYFDSAFVVDPRSGLLERYDKSHLVPFGEYVPLRGLFGGLLSAVATGIAPADVSAGGEPRALRLALPGPPGEVTVGVPICYELLFPDLVRRFVADGAGALLAITNDAWYGRTGAPYQFLAITALRSAETGVWTARAANTGVSAFIDARGRVREETPIFERGLLVAELPLADAAGQATFYVRHGDVFAWACWVALLARAVLPARGGAAQRRGGAGRWGEA
jgi:apolipoprotein N-acyltransferase